MGVTNPVAQTCHNSKYDECLFDLNYLEEALHQNSARLFVTDDKNCVQFMDPGSEPIIVEGLSALQNHLNNLQVVQGTRVVYIPQPSSVDPLVISEAGLRCLVSKLEIFPPFFELLQAFGEKAAHAPRAAAALQVQYSPNSQKTECCFLLKHVERHGRTGGADDWSIRQIGVYSQMNDIDDVKAIVLLNPSKRFRKRYFEICKHQKLDLCDVETLLFSACLCNWNQYLDYLETRMHEKISSAFASSTEDKRPSSAAPLIDSEASPGDVRTLLHIAQRLEMVHSSVSLNLEVLNRRSHVINSSSDQRGATMAAASGSLLARTAGLKMRLDNALELVSRTLDIRNAQRSMQLSHRQARDSRSLKTIAILTLLYLPASFVATLLSMNYIHVTRSRPLAIVVDNDFLVFIILTLGLLTTTAAVWACSEFIWRKQMSQSSSEAGMV